MKTLKDILYKVAMVSAHHYDAAAAVAHVCFDSRKVQKGSLFIAVRGTQVDGHSYIDATITAGATIIVCETLPTSIKEGIIYIQVADSSLALAIIADNFYDNPSSRLHVIGVTGTNGKTTTATLLFRLFRGLGYSCGLLSTIQNQIDDDIIATSLTTPDALSIAELMHTMVEKGCTHCFMEASSIALHQKRVAAVQFKGAIFTNLTHDHLDYHGDFKTYRDCKKILFDNLSSDAFALVNADDDNGAFMLQNTVAKKYTYSLRSIADFYARILENSFDGLVLQIKQHELHSSLIGYFNAYNLLAVYAAAVLSGEEPLKVLTALSALRPAEGRFDHIRSANQVTAIVDYAHTPDALEQVLDTIQKLRTGNGQIITVVGCGGNRDKTKRPVMAQIAARLSDKVILTSDNPRQEDPEAIIEDMKVGLREVNTRKILSITDRKEAIKTACVLAQPHDIILLAGKGHEKYQEIKGVKMPFDDKQIVTEFLNAS